MTKAAFAPHKLDKHQLKALHDHVIVSDMIFDSRITQSGIILMNDNGTTLGIRPRWGRVYAIGPKQEDVKIGQWILVAHGRWTRGLDIEDETGEKTIRRIDVNDVLMVSDEEPVDDNISSAILSDKKDRW